MRDRVAAQGKYAGKGVYRRGTVARKPVEEGTCCSACGWPFKSTSSIMLNGRNADGENLFRHALCPSLSERRRMRQEALANA